jgi:hypothetical protein
MRYFALALVLVTLPATAAAQQSWSLPSIGLPPPPSRPVNGPWIQKIPWEQPQTPSWEKPQRPSWERREPARRGADDDARRRPGGANHRRVIYVPYAVALPQDPQVIVVQQPPVTRIVHVEVPASQSEARAVEAPKQAEPPYVPKGDRTLYVIPGCYVGNVSPINLKLPAGCDITKLTTYVP